MAEFDELRILKVFSRQSGDCLFSHRWKWHADAHEEGLNSLIQSFLQFSREIDGGDLMELRFDQSINSRYSNIMRQNRSNHRNSVAAGRSSFIDALAQSDELSRQSWFNSVSPSPQHSDCSISSMASKNKSSAKLKSMSNASASAPSIQMLSCHDKVVQVILFHDQTDSSREVQLRRFLQQALSQFVFYFADDVIQGHGTSSLPIQPSDPSSSLDDSSKDIEASCAVTASLSDASTCDFRQRYATFRDVIERQLLPQLVQEE
uniref:Uncharacterized protein AlNc14C99G5967 n=1 Tax=Albugo laibachii Nc14 TaxID=890382 RepID=F0WHA1_9STRA|nr:conserved hypothetical protein [Albugo laibachii Nc14]|eukprot:CCA20617.1 conserved hypothetical protein [Albugo laibachii Nc14]